MKLFKDLYAYRELLKNNVKKDVRGKYKGSFLGVLWTFMNPLLMTLVYAIVFPFLMKGASYEHYTTFLIIGILAWNWFGTCISQGTYSVLGNGGIIKKVYFPREIIPISVVTGEAINFLISTVIILGFVIFSGMGLSRFMIFYPLILITQYLVILAFSFIVSSVCVYLRDLQHFIGIALQLLFYAAPIVYSPNAIPAEYQWILKYNPMTYIINAYRSIFYEHSMIELKPLLIVLALAIIGCIVGYFIYSKLQKGFAEQL